MCWVWDLVWAVETIKGPFVVVIKTRTKDEILLSQGTENVNLPK